MQELNIFIIMNKKDNHVKIHQILNSSRYMFVKYYHALSSI